ncbi:hypothetical protein H310_13370 [Aphanomyces invadans]|uniref:Uncharacterized protein n=1 Tax=Aphanomyces invadans TaxID=157072 RepID=A0A024TFF3_9STRA|nr:hypothetical protein H310_13370 [Aphanomyces invadans]ETV92316.1 hypothetical protein H310_13370 [Aphanomyces invadans]|eukprot:XP_008879067.1 hypothetical protein H310_13370 [Aphanomyces invadans]
MGPGPSAAEPVAAAAGATPTPASEPARTAAASYGADGRDDESMGASDRMVFNAPAIPQAPKFKGSTKTVRRQFMREYNQYLEQVAALQTTTTKPLVMPVSACIDHYTKKRLAMWELDKPADSVTEAEWVGWMRLGYDVITV